MVLPEDTIYKLFQNLNCVNKLSIARLGELLCRHEGLFHVFS